MRPIKCHNCKGTLKEGDSAYAQKWRRTEVRGQKVNVEDVTVLVCETCAAEKDSK